MKLSELTTGMRVKHRNGEVGIVLKDIGIIAYQKGYNFLTKNSYNEDLTLACDYNDPEQHLWNIDEVFDGFTTNASVIDLKVLGTSIWKRNEKSPEQIQLSVVLNQIEALQKEANKLNEIIWAKK